MMGGDIRVESTEGVGSSFIIEMPQTVTKKHKGLEAEASMTSSNETLKEIDENSAHLKDAVSALGKETPLILIVDDEASARDLLTRALEQQGCQVQCARDGNEGLKLAADLKPDLITLDIMMPGMDGWTVLRKLKADKTLRDIPVLMVSMIGDRGMSYELGAVDAIQKPVDRAKLRMFVDRYAKNATKNALIVEDDESARSNIKSFLKKDGWAVAEAENGAVGLSAAGTKAFDLILLDLMMPVMDGFEFLHNLRASDLPSSHSPVVVVTAKDLNAQDRARLSGSVDDVVSKSGRSVEQIVEEVKASLNLPGKNSGEMSP
jgi:CheY-like chemotaxis protein